mgnify:CR=1 FL=1
MFSSASMLGHVYMVLHVQSCLEGTLRLACTSNLRLQRLLASVPTLVAFCQVCHSLSPDAIVPHNDLVPGLQQVGYHSLHAWRTQHSRSQHSTAWHNTAQHDTTRHSMAKHMMVQAAWNAICLLHLLADCGWLCLDLC